MEKVSQKEQRIWLWIMLLSSSIGVSIWYFRGLASTPIADWWQKTIFTFSFFTNFSNGIIVVMAAALLIGRGPLYNVFKSASVQAASCLYVAFVGLGFWILLGGPGQIETILDLIPELTAHTLSPILGALYFVRVVPKGRLTRRDPFLFLIYPLLYLIYWLIRGPRVGYYPYFFLDVNALGYSGVAVWSAILLVAFIILGFLMLFINSGRWLQSRSQLEGG
jgi:hypothetical protein